ncbi:MAG: radical SAM protein [Deltaproteobacteria bacterium]|nr:radical SAM protein [Deltaproteobacteria bacterium]
MFKKYLQTFGYAWKNYRAGEAIYPFYASLKVSNVCASKCPYCDLWKEMRENPMILPKEKCFQILDNLERSSILCVSFEGGEPFLHKDIVEILKYAATKPFFTELTCSAKPNHMGRYPIREASPYLDFLHFSIDEGHENLELYDHLHELRGCHPKMSVQIVVSRETIRELEWKVKRIHEYGMWTIIMPAAPLDKAENVLPNLADFVAEVARLKRKYRRTILTSDFMLANLLKSPGGCSAASIVIDGGGKLYYPCRVLEKKTVDLSHHPLNGFVTSPEAGVERDFMKRCDRPCGWCQYYGTVSATSVPGTYHALKPWIQYAITNQLRRIKGRPPSELKPVYQRAL